MLEPEAFLEQLDKAIAQLQAIRDCGLHADAAGNLGQRPRSRSRRRLCIAQFDRPGVRTNKVRHSAGHAQKMGARNGWHGAGGRHPARRGGQPRCAPMATSRPSISSLLWIPGCYEIVRQGFPLRTRSARAAHSRGPTPSRCSGVFRFRLSRIPWEDSRTRMGILKTLFRHVLWFFGIYLFVGRGFAACVLRASCCAAPDHNDFDIVGLGICHCSSSAAVRRHFVRPAFTLAALRRCNRSSSNY